MLLTCSMFWFQLRTRTTERKRRPQTIAVDMTELHQQTAHNYSIQTLNSTELAKEKLRQVLSKVRVLLKSSWTISTILCVFLARTHARTHARSRVMFLYEPQYVSKKACKEIGAKIVDRGHVQKVIGFVSQSANLTGSYLSGRPQVSMSYRLINHAGCW